MDLVFSIIPITVGGIIAGVMDIKLRYKSMVLYFFIGALSAIGSCMVIML